MTANRCIPSDKVMTYIIRSFIRLRLAILSIFINDLTVLYK